MQSNKQLSQDDVNLYDRQIRLWGAEAQIKIKNVQIVILDGDKPLTAEIVKNLRLSGCENLSIITGSVVLDETTELVVISGRLATELSNVHPPIIYAVCNGGEGAVSTMPSGFHNHTMRLQSVNNAVNIKDDSEPSAFQPAISVIAAVCVQEVIKRITGQHQPLDNTFLFDALHLKSLVKSL